MKKTARVATLISVAALTLTGCGDRGTTGAENPPSETPAASESTSPSASESASGETNPDFKACMVSDSGGFEDKSFNQTSHDGLEAAKESLGIKTGEVESQSDSEYAGNIDALVQQDCNHITTVGFLLGDATEAAAKANADVDFSIVDYGYEKPPKNLKGVTFNTAEPSFLAGYLAAGMSETGIVGTFGGLPIPTVTVFMTGFYQGVEKYNEDNDADVQVVGWDPKTEKGSFTEDFEDKTKGQTLAENMIQQGADIIFPVAGPAGLGGLQAAQDNEAKAIWVDTDGCESAAEYCDVLLTSVLKAMDVAVEASIQESVDGEFSNEVYVGTLENGGVGLAPYHEFESEIPAELTEKIDELKQQIIDGELKVG